MIKMTDLVALLNADPENMQTLVTSAKAGVDAVAEQGRLQLRGNEEFAATQSAILTSQGKLNVAKAEAADALAATKARTNAEFSTNALAILHSSNAQLGQVSAAAEQLLQDSSTAYSESAKLNKTKPGLLSNPFGWIVDTLKSHEQRGIGMRNEEEAQALMRNAANLRDTTNMRLEQLNTAHKVSQATILEQQSVAAMKGVGTAEAVLATTAAKNATVAEQLGKQWEIVKGTADYNYKLSSLALERDKEKRLKLESDLALEEKKHRDATIDALYQLNVKFGGAPVSPLTRAAAVDQYTALMSTAEGRTKLAELTGLHANTFAYATGDEAKAAIVAKGTVGEVRAVGQLTKDERLSTFGNDVINTEANNIFARTLAEEYTRTHPGKPASGREFTAWQQALSATELRMYTEQANALATATVMSRQAVQTAKTMISATPPQKLVVSTWTPEFLEANYGIPKDTKMSKVMSDPRVQLEVANAQLQGEGTEPVVNALFVLNKALKANGVAAPHIMLSQLLSKDAASSAFDPVRRPQVALLKQLGMPINAPARVEYDGKPYDLSIASDLENLLVRRERDYNSTWSGGLRNLQERTRASTEQARQRGAAEQEAMIGDIKDAATGVKDTLRSLLQKPGVDKLF